MAGPFLSGHLEAAPGERQAGTLVGRAVDDHEAVEADADAAEQPARSTLHPGGAPRPDASRHQGGTDGLAVAERHRLLAEAERARHAGSSAVDAANRVGLKGVMSSARSVAGPPKPPWICCATSSPVAGASPIPAPS